MQAVPFAGLHHTGSVELDAHGIAARIWGWAEVMREMEFMADQLMLPGLLP